MSKVPDRLSSVFERFFAFERDAGLFSREVCGVRFWHYIRFYIYSVLVLPSFVPMDTAHPDMHAKAGARPPEGFGKRLLSKCRRVWRMLRMSVTGNPSFALRRRDVLISLAPRTTSLDGGRRIRLAVDFFVERLKSSWCVLELPTAGSGYAVHDGSGRRFFWEAARRAMGKCRASAGFRAQLPEISAAAKRLSGEMAERLGIPVDERALCRRMESAVVLELAAVPLLRRWLRRLGVRCVVEVVHYCNANMALTRAAHEEGLPVVELQHGTVVRCHAAYNLPCRDTLNSPDYLLSWGDFWSQQTRNFSLRGTRSVGYPYLEGFLPEGESCVKPSEGSRRTVVYVSQGTVGAALAASAVKLRSLLPAESFAVVFKLHPNETKTWRSLYPGLEGSGVEVVDDPQRSIYSIYNSADATVGAYSTALVEGFLWGLPAFVLRALPGSDLMEPFSAAGLLLYADSTEEIADCLRKGDWKKLRFNGAQADLCRRGAAGAIAGFIDETAAAGGKR